jgi:hypothetical protein
MFKHALVATIILCAFTSFASAGGLKDKKDHASEQTKADANTKAVNDNCGSKIKFEFEWATWKDAADESGHHASDGCGMGLSGMKGMCNGDDATKEAMTKQVKTVKCYGDAGKSASVTYKDGVVSIHTDLVNAGDITELTKKALKDGLK